MRINSLYLSGFKRFKFSAIRSISAEFANPIQIIIAKNGYGKTSLLNEMLPVPVVRSAFERDGSKKLTIQHDEQTYQLGYNSGDHSFKLNGSELNENQTFTLQQELIEKHLGISEQLLPVLKAEYRISEMTPAQRKALFYKLNPVAIGILDKKIKQVRKLYNGLDKVVLTYYQRYERLKSSKLQPKEYQQLKKQYKQLLKDEKLFFEASVTMAAKLRDLPASNFIKQDIQQDVKKLKVAAVKALSIADVDYKDAKELKAKYQGKIGALEEQLTANRRSIDATVQETNTIGLKLKKASKADASTADEIQVLQKAVDGYNGPISGTLSIDEIPKAKETLDAVCTLLVTLNDLKQDDILGTDELFTLQETYSKLTAEESQTAAKMQSCLAELQGLNPKIEHYKVADNCTTDQCELYRKYASEQDRIKARHRELTELHEQLKKNHRQLQDSCSKLKKKLAIQKQMGDLIIQLQTKLNAVGLIGVASVETLNRTPFKPAQLLEMHINASLEHHKYIQAKERLDQLMKTAMEQEALAKVNISALEAKHTQLTKTIGRLKKQNEAIQQQIDSLNLKAARLQRYVDMVDYVQKLSERIHQYKDSAELEATSRLFKDLVAYLDKQLSSIRTRLTEVSKELRTQESIQDRISKEVLPAIKEAKRDRTHAKDVLRGLTELQIEYSDGFVARVTETANQFLMQLFSYDAEVSFPHEWKIPALMDGTRIDDLSSCSSGQKHMVNLAYNFALRVELGLCDYPLYLDEGDVALDPTHKQNLIDLLNTMLHRGIMAQLLMVNHHVEFHSCLSGEYIIMDDTELPGLTRNTTMQIER